MNRSFERTIERLAIDADICDLTARFSDAVNRRDFNAFGDLFADNGAWEIGEPFPSRAAGRQRADGYRAESLTHDALKVLMDHGWRPAVIDALPLDLRGSLRLRRGGRRNLYHRFRVADGRVPAGTPSGGGPAPDRSARRPPRQRRTIKALGAALPVSADDAVSMARVCFRNRRGRRALPGWAAP